MTLIYGTMKFYSRRHSANEDTMKKFLLCGENQLFVVYQHKGLVRGDTKTREKSAVLSTTHEWNFTIPEKTTIHLRTK